MYMRPYDYHLKRTVEPTVEPLTLAELKTHVVQANSADDAFLTGLITTARQMFEEHTGLALIAQTYQLSFPGFPDEIRLRRSPIRSVTSITYYDSSGTQQTLAASVYRLTARERRSIIDEAYGQSWPTVESGREDAVTVTYIAGIYTDNAASPPLLDTTTSSYLVRFFGAAQQAIKILANHLYENRDLVAPIQLYETPMAYQSLVNLCRVQN